MYSISVSAITRQTFLPRARAADQHVGAQVPVLLQRDDGAEERQPDESQRDSSSDTVMPELKP